MRNEPNQICQRRLRPRKKTLQVQHQRKGRQWVCPTLGRGTWCRTYTSAVFKTISYTTQPYSESRRSDRQRVFYPPSKPDKRFRNMHIRQRWVGRACFGFYAFEPDAEGSFDASRRYHFKGLPRVGSVQGRSLKDGATAKAARTSGSTMELLAGLLLDGLPPPG